MQRVVEVSGIMDLDDSNWPEPDQGGRQELEVKYGNKHISFTCSKVRMTVILGITVIII